MMSAFPCTPENVSQSREPTVPADAEAAVPLQEGPVPTPPSSDDRLVRLATALALLALGASAFISILAAELLKYSR